MREYSKEYAPEAGMDPYYPEVDAEVQRVHEQYKELAAQLPSFRPLGRLAEHRYHTMDVTVANALALAEELLAEG